MVAVKRILRRMPWTVIVLACALCPNVAADDESDYYRLVTILSSKAPTGSRSRFWKPPPKGLVLEVSGMARVGKNRLAVTIRKGEVWFLDGIYDDPPRNVTYKKFAEALHEPLGLLKQGNSFLTAQRTELTRMTDTDTQVLVIDDETTDHQPDCVRPLLKKPVRIEALVGKVREILALS